MRTPEVQAKYKSIYIETSDLDAGAVADYIKAEAKLWGGVIRAAKITVDQ
jgi:tripartite-type tricarboxylate transporter receptor subunit TctC